MLITSTLQLIISSLAPSSATAPFDSCHSRLSEINKNLYTYVPPTAVVKLLQYSGLGSNTGMGFHPKNDFHKCKKIRLSIWTFWICFKNSMSSLKAD